VFLGSVDYVVVLISDRRKTGPVSSGVGAFPEVFSVSGNGAIDLKARRAGVNQGLDGD